MTFSDAYHFILFFISYASIEFLPLYEIFQTSNTSKRNAMHFKLRLQVTGDSSER